MQNVIIQCVKRTMATCLGKLVAGGLGEELGTQVVSAIWELYQRGPRKDKSTKTQEHWPTTGCVR